MGFDYRTCIGLWKQTLEGHKQNLVSTRTQGEKKKKAVTLQKNEPDFSVCVQESAAEAWVTVACHGVRGTEYNIPESHTCWYKSF